MDAGQQAAIQHAPLSARHAVTSMTCRGCDQDELIEDAIGAAGLPSTRRSGV